MFQESIEVAGKLIHFETGRIAKQANGAVLIRQGDTVLLVTAVAEKSEREGLDFFPMTVEYRERTAAAGRFPGGFFKREMRPANHETLTSRIIDRSLRPLFPKNFRCETQVLATVLSFDPDADPGILAITGASLALHVSDIPWKGPVVGLRVIQAEGRLIANPTVAEREKATLDIIATFNPDGMVMVEGMASEVAEATVLEALAFAQEAAKPLFPSIQKFQEQAGKPKRILVDPPPEDPEWVAKVEVIARPELSDILHTVRGKLKQQDARRALKERLIENFTGEEDDPEDISQRIGLVLENLYAETLRKMIIEENIRIDGRGPTDIRDISGEVGWLPRTHGSALFTRGETQAMVSCTLGTGGDEQIVEALDGEFKEQFMLHYNFPPYCVGEVRRMLGPGRRDIGHGTLARRALDTVLPAHSEFPYTIRIVSDISESNGSSSMATVCGGTLAMMDAGVPIRAPVAGIAMGLVQEGDKIIVFSDILGAEDHMGDMDFKVAGTESGITALQMDNKLGELSRAVLAEALEQARQGRKHILAEMRKILEMPRQKLSPFAPQVFTTQIRKERIRDLIGPGGRVIQQIQGQTGTQIEVSEDGAIRVYAASLADVEGAMEMIKYYTADLEKGKVYKGVVVSVKDFGAFVRIFASIEGLVHISELDNFRVDKVSDILKEGDEVLVRVLDVDRQGKIRLSRKEALDALPEEIVG